MPPVSKCIFAGGVISKTGKHGCLEFPRKKWTLEKVYVTLGGGSVYTLLRGWGCPCRGTASRAATAPTNCRCCPPSWISSSSPSGIPPPLHPHRRSRSCRRRSANALVFNSATFLSVLVLPTLNHSFLNACCDHINRVDTCLLLPGPKQLIIACAEVEPR